MLLSTTTMLFFSTTFRPYGINFSVILFFIVLFFSANTFGKSFNAVEKSRRLIKAVNPEDISSVTNGKGGIYIFWKESRSSIESKVHFAYTDLNSDYPSELTGRRISELSITQKNPISIPYIMNDAIIAWKDFSNKISGEIFIQRISDDQLLWSESGIRVTNSSEQIFDYSLTSDIAGNIFLAYVSRSEYPSNDYKILYQRILSDGSLTYKNEPILVEISARKKNKLKIIHDNNGQAFILWTENINGKESLLLKKVDASGKSILGKKPIRISGTLHSAVSYSISTLNNSLFYMAWEMDDKNIYHQLINDKGKALWAVGGTKATTIKNKNTIPRCVQNDSLITLCWLNEDAQNTSILVQRFKLNGNEMWTKNGVIVVSLSLKTPYYSVTDDAYGGIFISWIDTIASDNYCSTNIQRVNKIGELLWDSLSTGTSLSVNCEKGDLSVHTDSIDRAIIVCMNNANEICVERVQKFKAPENDFLTLNSESLGKSIKLKLNTNIKNEKLAFVIERLAHSDTSAKVWEFVGSIDASTSAIIEEHEFIDSPTEFGTLYYRATLKSNTKEIISNISRIDFLEAASKIVVAQNNPNPFNDSTVISFYLPVTSYVGFEFFNGHAEKISEFPEKVFSAGENSVTFYPDDLPPGIYFFRFYTRDFVEVKKMIKVD